MTGRSASLLLALLLSLSMASAQICDCIIGDDCSIDGDSASGYSECFSFSYIFFLSTQCVPLPQRVCFLIVCVRVCVSCTASAQPWVPEGCTNLTSLALSGTIPSKDLERWLANITAIGDLHVFTDRRCMCCVLLLCVCMLF